MIPIILICISYIIGIIWGLYLNTCLGIVFFCLLLFLLYKLSGNLNLKFCVCLLIIFIFGTMYINIKSYHIVNLYQEGEINVVAKVISEPEILSYYQKFIVKLDDGNKAIVYLPKEVDMNFGEKVQLIGVLEKPDVARNEGGFNYKNYLYSQNIYSIITVNSTKNIFKLENSKFNLIYLIRKSIYNIFSKLLPKNHMSILIGMIIGDTSQTSEEIKADFKISGISHLLAVSGSNVAYIVLAIKFLFNKITTRNVSNIITIIFIIFFMFISGCSASVVRAAIMAIIAIFSEIISRKSNTYASIAVSALIILIYNPFTVYDMGFVLSFLGTLGIVLLSSKINNCFKVTNNLAKIIVETISVTLAAQIVLLPIMWKFFNTISIISLLTNLIIVPITGVITIFGIMMYFIGLIYLPVARLFSYSIYVLIEFIIKVSSLCANVPFAQIILATPSWIVILIYYLIVYKFFWKNNRKFINVIISLLIVFEIFSVCFPNSYTSVNMVDVGQGDCIYIETRNRKRILIDCGGSENSDYDVGEKVLVPYILDKGTKTIDCVIITHMHEDHVEGIIRVIEDLNVKQIILGVQPVKSNLYEELLIVATKRKVPVKIVSAGDTVCIDNIKFEIIYPEEKLEISNDLNNNSLVMKAKIDDVTLLFTGDIEKEAEELILNENLNANILKVAHHGSSSSTTQEFLNIVQPEIALIGVGEDNKFGHPSSEVIDRLEKIDCQIFRTDNNGEIRLKLYKDGKIKINKMINE